MMSPRLAWFASLPFALVAAPACSSDGYQGPPEVKSDLQRDTAPNVSDQQLGALVAGNTELAAGLYNQVKLQPGNAFFSPHSIATALAMTYAGARGQTASEMATALHFTLPPDQLFAAQDALDLALQTRATDATSTTRPFQLHVANSIWGQLGKDFLAEFLDTLAVNYGAGLHVVDFFADPDGSRQQINGWVDHETQHKIPDLLPEGSITNATTLVLTNAIYFNAAWATPFAATDTAPAPFSIGGDAQVTVPTLHGGLEASYAEGAGWKAGALPYDGGKLEMVVVVPDDLATFEGTFSAAQLNAIDGALAPAALTVAMPKFTFHAPLDLKAALVALGMPTAFDPDHADLSGIDGTHELHIAKVLHQGFVGVDEAGTEAAAATAVVVEPGSAHLDPKTLIADRPFVFYIRDLPTGEILFLGRVVDPR